MTSVPIYYATSTGNAEYLAEDLKKRLAESGGAGEVIAISRAQTDALRSHKDAVFIVSTWGEGEPPDDALGYWESLRDSQMDLSGLHYCVFGLGDSAYTNFNAFGRMLDEQLAKLGATRLFDRVAADVNYDADYKKWAAELTGFFAERS